MMFIVKVRKTGREIMYTEDKEYAEEFVKDAEESDKWHDEYEEGYYQIVEYKC